MRMTMKIRGLGGNDAEAGGNRLYSWSHLELQRFFQVTEPLSPATCKKIWEHCNSVLKDLPVREMIRRSNVEVIITTDDPADDLSAHALLAKGGCSAKVLPGFRPDKLLAIESPDFPKYIEKLCAACGQEIRSLPVLKSVLSSRIAYFAEHGLPGQRTTAFPRFLIRPAPRKKQIGF